MKLNKKPGSNAKLGISRNHFRIPFFFEIPTIDMEPSTKEFSLFGRLYFLLISHKLIQYLFKHYDSVKVNKQTRIK